MVTQTGVDAVLNEILANTFDVAGDDGAANNDVLVSNLSGVDVHEYLEKSHE
jgi:hypothetical protein